MSELQNISNNLTSAEDQSAWGDLVICRVEVDLPNWLSQLAGGNNWQVYSESEYDHSMSFLLRQGKKEAEVTLFNNGYAHGLIHEYRGDNSPPLSQEPEFEHFAGPLESISRHLSV